MVTLVLSSEERGYFAFCTLTPKKESHVRLVSKQCIRRIDHDIDHLDLTPETYARPCTVRHRSLPTYLRKLSSSDRWRWWLLCWQWRKSDGRDRIRSQFRERALVHRQLGHTSRHRTLHLQRTYQAHGVLFLLRPRAACSQVMQQHLHPLRAHRTATSGYWYQVPSQATPPLHRQHRQHVSESG